MLKSLIVSERIETTETKAKALQRRADRMITLAKQNTLASRRRAIKELMVRFNPLTPKQQREAREGKTNAYNTDRRVIDKLFGTLGQRFSSRAGGYTRIIRNRRRIGDGATTCFIEYLSE
jgi:large subunit ribosomal protein L17